MKWYTKLCWIGLFSVLAGGCAQTPKPPEQLQDKPIAAFQTELLDEAFGFATAIPLEPHIKDRARYQEKAVTAALELGQPSRALHYADQIPNWRQGRAYADYAFYSVGLGYTNGMAALLDQADAAARTAQQDWRKERVWVRIAQTWRAMGNQEKAAAFGDVLRKTESGAAELRKSRLCTDAEFDEYSAKLDEQLAVGGLDFTKNALYTYVALYDRFFENEARCVLIEEKIESGWSKLPLFDRVEILKNLVESSIKHGNRESAVRLADQASEIVEGSDWPAEYHVQLLAKLAQLKIECDEPVPAVAELEKAMEVFAAKKADIINIYRAEALIPVAEAYARAGESAEAQHVYALAIEQAVINANSRPRAEDLCQILLSMATHYIQPEPVLWERIQEIQSNLGEPW